MSPTVYLVSGANRGLGLAFVTVLAQRENVVVFAGARNPAAATDLQALVKQHPGKVHAVKLTSSDVADNKEAVDYIKKTAGRLDVVIANAAIAKSAALVLDTPPAELLDHFDVNVVGVVVLFQATYPLLKESTSSPIFVPISSAVGSIALAGTFPPGGSAYASSKTTVNFIARKIHFEHEGIISFVVSPGAVDTEMIRPALPALRAAGFDLALLSPEDSASQVLKLVDNATRESVGGKFFSYDGTALEW
ncbi:hypothetical protein PLICRDRAFT_176838 [Plicaturopsis crispa FD-325 SS-3]|nr:hypothetical protein PLICRDRAFT_176838 [Plicaturopsis crispa FD-325 SS-3]